MSFIADTHVHVYPCHDAAALLTGAFARLSALAPGRPCVLCLTERSDCHVFADWSAWPERAPAGFAIRAADPAALRLESPGGSSLYVIAGRQMATAERIEVHALGCVAQIPDGLPTETCLERVRAAGGTAVLPWGVGKWLGGRGRLVQRLMAHHPDLLLGDTSLRPRLWPEPCLARAAERVIAGSDPLPAPGEERHAGRLATLFATDFDPANPSRSLVSALSARGTGHTVGSASSPLEMLRRSLAMKRAQA